MKGFVIAGTHSGAGKTTLALGFMAALKRRGLVVAPFKVGPDFIDPGHHTRVSGVVSRNLDGWMLSKNFNLNQFNTCTQKTDIAVIEGVMGLFDGYDGKSEAGSTSQMAKWLNLPVVLVVNAKSMARSAAALVKGFESFDPALAFAGVIFNNVGSDRHLIYLKEALEGHVNMPCLGGVIRNADITMPERHLGLVTQEEHGLSSKQISGLADLLERHVDLDNFLNTLPDITPASIPAPKQPLSSKIKIQTSKIRIGVASDEAFCFYYQDNLEMLEAAGAEIIKFSPIYDKKLPENLDGIYLGGGYPELFASKLAENKSMRCEIKEKSQKNMPIYGECGGFMYLCQRVCDGEKNYPMTGCFPFETTLFSRLKALGYREIILKKDTVIGKAGQCIRGHEFHYSNITNSPSPPETIYKVANRSGQPARPEGYQTHCTLGSYIHLHFGSQPDTAVQFVNTCRQYKEKRKNK